MAVHGNADSGLDAPSVVVTAASAAGSAELAWLPAQRGKY